MTGGLLGRKLGHSLSPQIHRLFGDHAYRLHEKEPADVEAFLRGGFARGEFDFLNVTIPYKRDVLALCDELSPVARRLGNVNFVMRGADGVLRGDNTDAFGFARLLDAAGVDVRGRRCAVLGAGGAAATATAVLEERGAAGAAFVRRGESPDPRVEVVVNATPVGMFPDVDGVRVDVRTLPACRAAVDLVYNPSPTRLVREARACGMAAADGLVMLIAQAWRAFLLAGGEAPRNLFLYGPPGSGKTTLARQIAAALGWTLVDLDAEIERGAGRTIAEIFADPAADFRAIERAQLLRVAARAGQVVALGGGALLDPAGRAAAEHAGRVALLDCPEETLARRVARSTARPLLAGDAAARLHALLESRRAHYASFPNRIEWPDLSSGRREGA